MESFQSVAIILLIFAAAAADGNTEGDALYALKKALHDPYMVLKSWNPTLVNPCTWYHVTCNKDYSVIRVDLGEAGLSGTLVSQLGLLSNLQYLELHKNNISGMIPAAIGNLTNLKSLDLYNNRLSGSIPSSLGNLVSLKFMRLNSNKLTGKVPVSVMNLASYGNLNIMNISDNYFEGTIRGSRPRMSTIIQDQKAPLIRGRVRDIEGN